MTGDTFFPFCYVSGLHNIYKSHEPINESTNHMMMSGVNLDGGFTFKTSLVPEFRGLPPSKLHKRLKTHGTIQK